MQKQMFDNSNLLLVQRKPLANSLTPVKKTSRPAESKQKRDSIPRKEDTVQPQTYSILKTMNNLSNQNVKQLNYSNNENTNTI